MRISFDRKFLLNLVFDFMRREAGLGLGSETGGWCCGPLLGFFKGSLNGYYKCFGGLM